MGTRANGSGCPRPGKRVYGSVEEAEAHIAEDFPHDPHIRPYSCVCGGIHIGHRRHAPEGAEA